MCGWCGLCVVWRGVPCRVGVVFGRWFGMVGGVDSCMGRVVLWLAVYCGVSWCCVVLCGVWWCFVMGCGGWCHSLREPLILTIQLACGCPYSAPCYGACRGDGYALGGPGLALSHLESCATTVQHLTTRSSYSPTLVVGRHAPSSAHRVAIAASSVEQHCHVEVDQTGRAL